MIIHGDCLEELQKLPSESVDFICTDPPYALVSGMYRDDRHALGGFMNRAWDAALPDKEVWRECLRVLKPGAFVCVMSAPRADLLSRMMLNIEQAGFNTNFTPLFWTYANGYPKAASISKSIDKRLGVQRTVVDSYRTKDIRRGKLASGSPTQYMEYQVTAATSEQAKALDGSYAGVGLKPAVEVVIIAMRPLSEATFTDQAIKNRKGVTWLDDGRIPFQDETDRTAAERKARSPHAGNGARNNTVYRPDRRPRGTYQPAQGRFPANLLVEDGVLGKQYSKFFDLGKWAATLPFLIVPKASQSERHKGLAGKRNSHPTVKSLKLFCYLITLFTRKGDTVLDPYLGSGTTCVAAEMLERNSIGIEREAEYVEIARARVSNNVYQRTLF